MLTRHSPYSGYSDVLTFLPLCIHSFSLFFFFFSSFLLSQGGRKGHMTAEELTQEFSIPWYKNCNRNFEHQYLNIKAPEEIAFRNIERDLSFPCIAMFHHLILICRYRNIHRNILVMMNFCQIRGIWPGSLLVCLVICMGTQPLQLCLTHVALSYGIGISALLHLPCSFPYIPKL